MPRAHAGDVRTAPTRAQVRRRSHRVSPGRLQEADSPHTPRQGNAVAAHTAASRERRGPRQFHPAARQGTRGTRCRRDPLPRPRGLFPHRQNSVNLPAGLPGLRRKALRQRSEATKPAASQRDGTPRGNGQISARTGACRKKSAAGGLVTPAGRCCLPTPAGTEVSEGAGPLTELPARRLALLRLHRGCEPLRRSEGRAAARSAHARRRARRRSLPVPAPFGRPAAAMASGVRGGARARARGRDVARGARRGPARRSRSPRAGGG